MSWQPLAGVRVIDVTTVVMGPIGTQHLADLGADVIVIEDRKGDANRAMGSSRHPELSGVALGLLRNKRSIGLDLKSGGGQRALHKIAATADVVVTNLRPKVRERLGLTRERLRAARDDVIVCAAAGFRPDSAQAETPAYDDVIQGLIAAPHMNTRVGLPETYFPTIFVDKCCGMAIAEAVMAALFHRERTGEGAEISLSMYEIMRSFVLAEHGADGVSFPGERPGGYERILSPDRAPQPTADGMIAALPYEKHHFESLFRLAGRDDLLDDPRIESRRGLIDHRTELRALVRECLVTKTTAEWLELLPAHGVPAGPLNTLDDIMEDLPLAEHPEAGTYKLIPGGLGQAGDEVLRRPAPLRWEHTREVLAEVGFDDAEIAALLESGDAYDRADAR